MKYVSLALFVASQICLISCQPERAPENSKECQISNSCLRFSDKPQLDLDLPITDKEFQSLMQREGIEYVSFTVSHAPKTSPRSIGENASKVYAIHGGFDEEYGVNYRNYAYVVNEAVVYIYSQMSHENPY